MAQLTTLNTTALSLGKVLTVLSEAPTAAGTSSRRFSIESDSVLVSVFATAVTGTVDIKVYTQAGDDDTQDVEVISFPTLSAPTSFLLLRKSAVVMQYVRIEATYTGSCSFTIKAKAINAGETSVSILSSGNFTASQNDVTNGAAELVIPVSLTDRDGLILKNNSTSGILYIGESSVAANSTTGYPIYPGESLAMDIAAGATVWGIADVPTLDVRILESGA